jgi:hypothetical protein
MAHGSLITSNVHQSAIRNPADSMAETFAPVNVFFCSLSDITAASGMQIIALLE